MHKMKEKHHCSLEADSKSMLPKLHPNASRFRKCLRTIRTMMIVTRSNPKTKYIFRSEESINMEKKRQIRLYPKYVIHPFSIIGMCREIAMAIIWFSYFSIDSFKISFTKKSERMVILYIHSIFNALHTIHMIACFFIGYHDKKKREVVLDHRAIVLRYLKTYFVFDFSMLIPTERFLESKRFYWAGLIIHMLVCARFISMTAYFRQITLLFDVGDIVHELLCMIVGGAFLAHWWAVFLYVLPTFKNIFISSEIAFSWSDDARISREYQNVSIFTKYIQSLHKASALFFGCSRGMWKSEDPIEWMAFSLIILSGVLYISYITAIILQLSMSYKMSESMYDKMLFQLDQYMKAKKLPDRLRVRLQIYYEARYRQKFFRETAILSTLSEHLRYEIIYHNCCQFIQSTWFFEDLPKAIVGHIIASLTSTILITNEVIFCDGEHDEVSLYFVSSGSIALYTEYGDELLHIEDGDYFGEFHILSGVANFEISAISKSVRYVASEITELFILPLNDFNKYIANFPQAMERLMEVAEIRDSLNIKLVEKKTQLNEHDFVNHLRNVDFLSTCRYRRMSTKHQYGGKIL